MHPAAALIREFLQHYAIVRDAQQRVARRASSAGACAAVGGDPEHAATVALECREADADRAREFAELLAVHDRLMDSALATPPLADIPGEPNPRAWLNETRLAAADILRHAGKITGRHRRADGADVFAAATPPGDAPLPAVRILERAADLIDAAAGPGPAGQPAANEHRGKPRHWTVKRVAKHHNVTERAVQKRLTVEHPEFREGKTWRVPEALARGMVFDRERSRNAAGRNVGRRRKSQASPPPRAVDWTCRACGDTCTAIDPVKRGDKCRCATAPRWERVAVRRGSL